MPYFVEIRVNPDYESVPKGARDRHIAFLDAHIDLILAGGGLWDDDGLAIHGGVYILDIEDRARAEQIVAQDPYLTEKVFEIVQITRWRKAYFNHKRLI